MSDKWNNEGATAMSKKTQNSPPPAKDSPNQTNWPRLILVGENKFHIKKAENFAKENHFKFHSYPEEEWATLEEIDQYIQEEELSKQIINLPVGKKSISSLEELESETIKRVVQNTNGNMMKAARILKIARATLYRKMEKYGMNLKKQREDLFKKQEKTFKKTA